MPSIKIENISDEDYRLLKIQAEAANAYLGKSVSLRNYVRMKLGIAPLKKGNPNAAELGRAVAARRKGKPRQRQAD